jgi:recombination protein RecA
MRRRRNRNHRTFNCYNHNCCIILTYDKLAVNKIVERNAPQCPCRGNLTKLLNACYHNRVIAVSRATAPSLANIPVFRATSLKRAGGGGSWRLENLVGVLAEISEEVPSGAVSFVAEIIAEAQGRNEPVAWVAGPLSIFFPPDLAERGIDLSAVAVIRTVADEEALTAVEWLAGCGALGLVVVDWEGRGLVSDAPLGRIMKLSERSQCAVVFLTRKRPHEPSLGSRISLRGCISTSGRPPRQVELRTVKDKRTPDRGVERRQLHGVSGMY